MNRTPLYSTNSNLYQQAVQNDQLQPAVIRPPIRAAYYSQQEYEQAVQNGINYARQENIEYIDHY
jgi:hypothetical protein